CGQSPSNSCSRTKAGSTPDPIRPHPGLPEKRVAMPTNVTSVKVPLLDLRAQYDTIRAEIDDAVRRVMESCQFIGGPEITALEGEVARYSQVPHAVACASGTDALLIATTTLGIGPGDE